MNRIVIANGDELTNRRLVKALAPDLEVVGTAVDGASALDLVRRSRPDAVLVGITVPPLGGLALIGAIRQESPDTQVVVLSDETREATVRKAFEAGACGYLLKDGSELVCTGGTVSAVDDGWPRPVPGRASSGGATRRAALQRV